MNGLIKIVIGLLVLILALYLLTFRSWLNAFTTIIRGGIIGLLILVTLALILLGFSELKE